MKNGLCHTNYTYMVWNCECVCVCSTVFHSVKFRWTTGEVKTYSMYNGGLCAISESDHGLGRGVYLYEGHRSVGVVDRLHHGPCKSLCLGDMVCGGARVVLTEYMQEILSAMVFVAVFDNRSQCFCPRDLQLKLHIRKHSTMNYINMQV